MKKTLCFVLALLLCLSACGRPAVPAQTTEPTPATEPTAEPTEEPALTAAPTAEPTAEPAPAEMPEPEDPLERALAYLHARKGNYTKRHLNTYLELYRMTHPGANLVITGYDADNTRVYLDMTGLDVRAFAESGYLPDDVTVRSFGFANEFVPLNEPIPREPEWDRVSDNGVRVTMDRAVWPVGAEYPRFTLRNEGEKPYTYGAEVQLEKYVEGGWQPVQYAGGILMIAYNLDPGKEVSLCPPTMSYPALGEGLYRVGFIRKGEWAEFAVSSDAKPPEPENVWRQNYPEAALLLAGLPETVESELGKGTGWPSLSSTWELTEEDPYSDRELAALLLGEGAEYDAGAGVYRLGDCSLSLGNGAELERDTLLAKALRLALPPSDPEATDLCAVPSLEQAGWKNGRQIGPVQPLDSLYPGIQGTLYEPDPEVLNARLEAALEALGEEAGELQGYRFTKNDLKDLSLLVVPVCTEMDGPYVISLCSPYGELAGAAAWCLCRNVYRMDREILALRVRLPGYRLTPGEQRETLSPLVQAEKFLPLLEGEEGLRLTALEYALIPGYWEGELLPVWRLRGETAEGAERTWAVSAVSKGASAYDLKLRTFLNRLQREIWDLFRAYRELHPEADVWCNSGAIQRDETGKEYLEVLCYGADIPELEASGFLPEEAVLNCPEISFFQKEAHPCPREPEWEKDWGTVTLTMSQGEYPLYPEQVELTVRCEKRIQRDWFSFKKYVDGEWLTVPRILSGTLEFKYVEAGETVFQVPTLSKLGPGLYRLYLSEKFWVEFKVTDS